MNKKTLATKSPLLVLGNVTESTWRSEEDHERSWPFDRD